MRRIDGMGSIRVLPSESRRQVVEKLRFVVTETRRWCKTRDSFCPKTEEHEARPDCLVGQTRPSATPFAVQRTGSCTGGARASTPTRPSPSLMPTSRGSAPCMRKSSSSTTTSGRPSLASSRQVRVGMRDFHGMLLSTDASWQCHSCLFAASSMSCGFATDATFSFRVRSGAYTLCKPSVNHCCSCLHVARFSLRVHDANTVPHPSPLASLRRHLQSSPRPPSAC